MKLLLILPLAFILSASFGQEKIFSTKAGAIKGYDPVAYFTESAPVKGDKAFSFEWNGATWFFSSQKHLDLFKASPEKYAPAFGGFCAYGVAQGYKVKIEPEAWSIVDGRLYLNYDLDVQNKWNADRSKFISEANKKWISLEDE
jgi:YHS domain-containing protein